MDTFTLLVEQLALHPDDELCHGAAADLVYERGDLSYNRALALVWAEAEMMRTARTVAQATNLMRSDTESGQYLGWILCRCIALREAPRAPVVVIPGPYHPTAKFHPRRGPRRANRASCVTVGAEWIIQQWEQRLREYARRAARGRPTHR